MWGYKCDKCGCRVNVDPGEPRICDACLERQQEKEQQETARIVYKDKKREVCYAG